MLVTFESPSRCSTIKLKSKKKYFISRNYPVSIDVCVHESVLGIWKRVRLLGRGEGRCDYLIKKNINNAKKRNF